MGMEPGSSAYCSSSGQMDRPQRHEHTLPGAKQTERTGLGLGLRLCVDRTAWVEMQVRHPLRCKGVLPGPTCRGSTALPGPQWTSYTG